MSVENKHRRFHVVFRTGCVEVFRRSLDNWNRPTGTRQRKIFDDVFSSFCTTPGSDSWF